MTMLATATDAHFAWFLGEGPAPDGLRQPPGGVDDPEILRIVRRLVADLRAAGRKEHWLVVDDGEIVGLGGMKRPPEDGRTEIGFGIAPGRRGRRFASRAVRLMVEAIQRSGVVHTLAAATAADNLASQAVLDRNGFVRIGERDDPEDGRVIEWERTL